MAKYTAKLVADTSQHDAAIGKSKQQVYKYQKGVEDSKKKLEQFTGKIKGGAVGALTQFAGVIGVAMGAMEGFNKVVRSNQTISDKWDSVIRAATTTVDNFFYSISTGDFTAFENGLDGIITKAKQTQAVLDELGNAQISFSYFNSKHGAELAEQLTIAKDKTKSKAERDAAVKAAQAIIEKQKTYTNSLGETILKSISAVATEKNALSNIAISDLEKMLEIDLLPNKNEVKNAYAAQYEEYLRLRKQIQSKYTNIEYETVGMGMNVRTRKVDKTDYAAMNSALAPLNNKYKEAILYNELLVKMSDEQLTNLTKMATEYENNNRAVAGMQTQMLRLTNQTATTTNNARVALEGSIAALDEQIANLELEFKYATDTESRNRIQAEINALKNQKIFIDVEYRVTGTETQSVGLPKTEIPKFELPKTISYIDTKPIQDANKGLTEMENKALSASSAVSSIGNMFTALGSCSEDGFGKTMQAMGAITGGISEMIPQIIALTAAKQGEAMASGVAGASKLPFPASLGAIASIVATLIGTFAQIKSITGFANGGIIGGNTTIGDYNLARVNKGEMILNGSQQSKLFRLLSSNGAIGGNNDMGGNVQFKISGKDLVGILSTQNKRTSKVI